MGPLLQEMTIGALVGDKAEVFTVPDTATLGEALSRMRERNILAVIVTAEEGKWIGAGGSAVVCGDVQYIGTMSVLDALQHLASASQWGSEGALDAPVTDVIGRSEESKGLWAISPKTSLLDAVDLLSRGLHRLLVPVGGELAELPPGPLTMRGRGDFRMLSQSDLAHFLLQEVDQLGPAAARSVEELQLLDPALPPLAVPGSMALLRVLRLMQVAGALPAVAVVVPEEAAGGPAAEGEGEGEGEGGADPAPRYVEMEDGWVRGGRLCGTLSCSDFRGLTKETLAEVADLTVAEFLLKVSGGQTRPQVCCRPQTPLATVLAQAVSAGTHRVWVTDDAGWLVGVVTFSDMFHAIARSQE